MAATASARATIDFNANRIFAVKLGNTITKARADIRYSSVRYNHKPTLVDTEQASCKILPGEGTSGGVQLSLQSGDGAREWQYTGYRHDEQGTYVLVFAQDEGKSEVTLERLDRAYAVNLTRGPDGAQEPGIFPRLPDVDGEDEAGLFGDGDGDEAPDSANPFDYRHFLKAAEEEKARKTQAASESAVGTPSRTTAAAAVGRRTPATKPATSTATGGKKRKTPASSTTQKANPKRVKAGLSPPTKAASSSTNGASKPATASKQQNSTIPEVRLDRKASTIAPQASSTREEDGGFEIGDERDDDDDDGGELILENDSPALTKRSQHLTAGGSMGLALSGAFTNGGSKAGPRSLRSAASMSPAVSPHVDEARSYEFEFGEDDDDDDGDEGGEVAQGLDADEDEDADVEDLALGSPVQEQKGRFDAQQLQSSSDQVLADEDDDMEAQLALAMAQPEEEDEEVDGVAVESEEDVSEEE